MGANKQISCKIYFKVMRSDHLKRRMKIHGDLSSEDSKQLCKDIESSKDETSMYKRKDTHSDKLDNSRKPLTMGVDKMKLRNTILHYDHEHKQKLELGEVVHEIIRNDEVDLDSLRPEYKEALDLYKKKSVESIPEDIEFKP